MLLLVSHLTSAPMKYKQANPRHVAEPHISNREPATTFSPGVSTSVEMEPVDERERDGVTKSAAKNEPFMQICDSLCEILWEILSVLSRIEGVKCRFYTREIHGSPFWPY